MRHHQSKSNEALIANDYKGLLFGMNESFKQICALICIHTYMYALMYDTERIYFTKWIN